MVSLEVGSRFRLPTGELVEVVVNVRRVLNSEIWVCEGCCCNTVETPINPMTTIANCFSIRKNQMSGCPFHKGIPKALKLVEEDECQKKENDL